VDLKRKYIRKS